MSRHFNLDNDNIITVAELTNTCTDCGVELFKNEGINTGLCYDCEETMDQDNGFVWEDIELDEEAARWLVA